MRLYLVDLDDTLIRTFEHVRSVVYPSVARSIGCPAPADELVRATWGRPFEDVIPQLFSGRSAAEVLPVLLKAHRASPPPPIPGVIRRLERIRQSHDHLVIFSAGNPDIVQNSVSRSLGLDIVGTQMLYGLPNGRRLEPVDIDIIKERLIREDDMVILHVFSDNPLDRVAVDGDPYASFYGVTTGTATTDDHILRGVPRAQVFSEITEALDTVLEQGNESDLDGSQMLSELHAGIAERRFVIFVGAGISVESDLPTAAGLAGRLGHPDKPLDRIITGRKFDPTLYSDLFRIIADPRLRPNRQHRALALLDAPYYVSTNWDHLLERAFMDLYGDTYGDSVGVAYIDAHLPNLIGKRNSYIKLHGDIDRRESLVYDYSSYGKHISSPTLLDKLVEVLLNTSAVLFVGYSMADLNVILQLIEHTTWEGGVPPPRFALLDRISADDRNFLAATGVRPIEFDVITGRSIGDRTFDLLARLHDAQEDFVSDARLLFSVPTLTPTELFYRALTFYSESEFSRALRVIRNSTRARRRKALARRHTCHHRCCTDGGSRCEIFATI